MSQNYNLSDLIDDSNRTGRPAIYTYVGNPQMKTVPYNSNQRPGYYHQPTYCQQAFVTSASLQYLTIRRDAKQKRHETKGCIELNGESFSDAFSGILGDCSENVYGLEDEALLEATFENLVEAEASRQFPLKQSIGATLALFLRISEPGLFTSGDVDCTMRLHFRCNSLDDETGWVNLVSKVLNLPRIDAVATLARIVNMEYTNLFQMSSESHAADAIGASPKPIDRTIPNMLSFQHLSREVPYASLVDFPRDIIGNAGQIIASIVEYRCGSRTFCLPATVGRQELCLAKYKPTAYFLNQDRMNMYPGSKIALCQDMRTALALEYVLGKCRSYKPEELIVIAHLGDDLSVLPWSYLHRRDVVFFCAPTKKCMSMARLYKTCIDRGAGSFTVYPGLVLHTKPVRDLKGDLSGLPESEAELLRGAVSLDEVERPLELTQKGVSFDEFKAWGQKLDIDPATELWTRS